MTKKPYLHTVTIGEDVQAVLKVINKLRQNPRDGSMNDEQAGATNRLIGILDALGSSSYADKLRDLKDPAWKKRLYEGDERYRRFEIDQLLNSLTGIQLAIRGYSDCKESTSVHGSPQQASWTRRR